MKTPPNQTRLVLALAVIAGLLLTAIIFAASRGLFAPEPGKDYPRPIPSAPGL